MTSFRLHLLGRFELTDLDGEPCALPPKKCRALLAWICLSRARTASRTAMASMLWPEASEEQARTSLRQCLAALRRVAPLLEADTESIALSSALTDVDVWQFEQGAGHDDVRVAEPALQRYGGELLAGLQLDAPEFEQWRRVEAERLRQLATQAGARIVDVLARSGDAGRAVENALRVLAIDPLQEDLHRRVMQLYVALGRPADAIRQYRRCRELLATELGTRPEPETEALYRKLVDPERRQTLIPGTPPAATSAPVATERGQEDAGTVASDAREAFVAIADVSGFAAYSATHDVDLVHEFLTRYRSAVRNIVQARGGMLANFIGARVMIVFGTPVARGNDAARIVDASLSILAAVESLQGMAGSALKARAGVATGRVIAAREEGQWIISGAPVSAAGRIVETAPAGEVWIADRIAQALGERLEAEPVEGAVVSALGNDQRLWRAHRLGRTGTKRAGPFVGRHDCLEAACGLMRSVQAERRGHLLVIGGEAGIGKSRLLAEVLLRAAQRDFAVHLVRATDVQSASASKPAAAAAASLLDLDPFVAATGSSLDESLARLALPSTLRAPLAHLLEIPMPARDAGLWQAMDETARQRAVEFALVRLTTAAARQAPLVLAVDDHHWTDEPSADLLRAIALGTKMEPVLLVLSTRRGLDLETDAWSDALGADAITELSLSPLSRDDSRRLAWSYGVDDAGFLDSCVERAQGHPFFLDQLLRHGAGAAGTLPGSIQNIVLARVDSLEPRDRAALQAAAILGHRFDLDALRATLDDPLYEPQPLIARALLSAEGSELRFAHALIRDSVSSALRTPMQRTLHQRAAAHFARCDPAVAAGHAAAAGDPGAAAQFLEAAVQEASRRHFERSLALAERGLACPADAPLRAELGYVAGESLLECNDAAGAEARLREALNGAASEELRCRIRIALAECLRLTDRQAEALAQLDEATALAHRLEDARLTARVELLRGNALFPLGRAAECLAAYARAHALSRQVSAIELQAQALGGLGDAEYQRGRFATAHRLFGECVEVARGRHLRQVEISNLPMLAVTHAYQLELQLGAKLSDHAAELSRAIRSVRSEAIAQAVRAEIGCIAGQWNEVAAAADRCIELSRRIGARRFEADGITYSAMAMWALGNREEACRQLEDALDLVRTSALSYCGPIVLACLAWMSHDPRQRARALAEARDILGKGAVSHNYLHFHAIAAEIALSERDPGQALAEAQALERYLDGEVTAWPRLVIDRSRALVRHLEGERTEALRAELAGLHARCLTAGARPSLGRLEAALGAFA